MDQSGQQVDLRKRNSWLLKLDEVSVGEAAEVLAINTLAPFVLNAQLRTPSCNLNADFPRFFYRKCRENGELPLKNDDFVLKNGHLFAT